ncbi:RsmE family RNA methyltransferase [Lactobacillaceae bacterium L1_55_11]|nr:RsmE family RNA methyltransferase [Lactobacillaceae bacterium L1_55_11]
MQRYFLDQMLADEVSLPADGDTYQHLARVLRAKVGQQVELVSADQKLYLAQVKEVDANGLTLSVLEEIPAQVELPIRVTLVVSPVKNDRNDWLVQKATEMGADRIVFTDMARTVAAWKPSVQAKKLARMGKIAKAAAEQSHRLKVPAIDYLKTDEAINLNKDLGLVAWEEVAKAGEDGQLYQRLNQCQAGQELVAWFGPEGGLTEKEINALTAHGFAKVGLGPRILRAETAPLYFLAAVSLLSELH